MVLTIIKLLNRMIDIVLFMFFLLLFLIGCYTLYDTILIYNNSNGEDLRTYKPIITDNEAEWDMDALSKDTVAWITIDDTNIDYPVMQGKDNVEYLSKDSFGEYSLAGSLFLDFRDSSDFTDEYSLIYGHHMEYGHMFGALDSFLDKNYFNNHRTGTLIVADKIYNIQLFACLEADGTTSEIFIPDSSEDAIRYTKHHAIIWNEPNEGRLLALSTCKYPETTERIIIMGIINERE